MKKSRSPFHNELRSLLRRLEPEKLRKVQDLLDRDVRGSDLIDHTRVPIATFRPHDRQADVIASHARVRLVLGGNRSGKTHVGAALAIANALGYRPWDVPGFKLVWNGKHWDFPPRDRIPPTAWVHRADGEPISVPNTGVVVSGQGIRIGLGVVIADKIREFWPPAVPFQTYVGLGGAVIRIGFPNGSTIHLTSSEQGSTSVEGWRAAWAWIDEPIPAKYVMGIWRGLTDLYGSLVVTLTPLGPNARWLYDHFVATDRTDTEVFRFRLTDNPYLRADAREAFTSLAIWSEAERAARLEGEFEFFENRVFPTFDRRVHVVSTVDVPRHWTRVCAIDPHAKRPWYLLWLAVSPDRSLYVVYDEWPEDNFFTTSTAPQTLRDYAKIIREREADRAADVRVIDPVYGATPLLVSSVSRKTRLVDELALAGIPTQLARCQLIQDGIDKIRQLLAHDDSHEPALHIARRCHNLVRAMESLSFRESGHDVEKVAEEFKDPVDALRYAVLVPLPPRLQQTSYLPTE